MRRGSGVLLHISSLPGPYGIGSLGSPAYLFVDHLHEAEQSYWQILPCTPPACGNSPYQSTSAFAGNIDFIDLDLLVREGLLDESDLSVFHTKRNPSVADYELNKKVRGALMRKATKRGLSMFAHDFSEFRFKQGYWLFDYALFEAFREHFDYKSWDTWPEDIRYRDPSAEMRLTDKCAQDIEAIQFGQFLYFRQWAELRDYATRKDVKIIGDLPIYVAPDSVECWASPQLFRRDEAVAGVPPDAFSETGQNWGSPVYDWEYMRNNGFEWWVSRIAHNLEQYDYLRFDHFRGIESYYMIPKGAEAVDGHWEKAPGRDLIDTLRYRLGYLPIIAEDLGYLTQDVHDLLAYSGFPGTKVLQFAFDDINSSYLPHNYERNCVVYTGTHDNDTTKGWFENITKQQHHRLENYVGPVGDKDAAERLIRVGMESVADCAIAPMQDILNLGTWARMNYPGKPLGNWEWRMEEGAFDAKIIKRLRRFTRAYGRGSFETGSAEPRGEEV